MYKMTLAEVPAYSEKNLRIIFVEDVLEDAEIVRAELQRSGITGSVQRVDNEHDFLEALTSPADVILCDFSLPTFDGLSALQIAHDRVPDTPFIFVSGTMGEELAVDALHRGAYDYVLKHNIVRLPSAVRRALQSSHQRVVRRRTEDILLAESHLLSVVFDTAGAIGIMFDLHGNILRFNQAGEHATGYDSKDIVGLCFWDVFFTPEQSQREKERYTQAPRASFPIQHQGQWLTREGRGRSILCSVNIIENRDFKTIFILSGMDITEWQDAEEKIYRLSHFDQFTGLPNRAVLRDRLVQFALRQEISKGMVALMLVEFSGLAHIRDALGARAGAAMMIALAERLQQWRSPEAATIAQYSDGVFAVVIGTASQNDVDWAAQDLCRALLPPYAILDQENVYLLPKIGITLYPGDSKNVDSLFQFAEIALHRAQSDLREHYQFYTPELNRLASQRHLLGNQLREAISRNELLLHYQPQISLKSGNIVGFEALVRWLHADRGLISPEEFIPLAEETGVIFALGEWVLRTACHQCKAWLGKASHNVTIAVNLSAMQFTEHNLKVIVGQILAESSLDAKHLELELTESASMDDPEKSIAIMVHLRKLGVTLSIDDFGTGYSNLGYLKRFPIGRLKIDKSFVRDIVDDPNDLAICRAIIALAKSLHLEVIAEGVETIGQLKTLHAEGCDMIQGYYFSAALSALECTSLLERQVSITPESIRRLPYARSLLIIDDEANILSALKRSLSRLGFQIFTANNASQAFEILAAHQIGVVLSDHQMPDMLGTVLLEKVRYMYPGTVRMMLTGQANMESVTQAINQGAIYKFLTKPWDNAQLESAIHDAFDKYELTMKSGHGH